MNKQYNTGSGPGVPIISSVPRIPTPQYTMNIVNGLEIIAHPAKGTNNLNQVNNNTSRRTVYLDNGEKNQKESIVSNFNKDNNSLDHLRGGENKEWYETTEENDEQMEVELEEALEIINKTFNMPDGTLNKRRCEKYRKVLEMLHESVGRTLAENIIPTVVQNAVQSETNGIQGEYEEEMRRALAGEMVMKITRPCDYCSQYTYLQEIGKECSMCERYKDLDYCAKCWFCQNNKKTYNNANNRVTTSQYVQVIKRKKVEEMLAIQPIVTAETIVTAPIVTPTKFNRNGNFEDKFLAVTYTLDDGDMTRDNVRYLVRQLEDNFMKLTQIKSMPCKGYIYVIEYTKALVPHLHGLVRMSGAELTRSISAKDNTFTGRNKIITKRPGDKGDREEKLKMLLRPINVEGWIAYMEKNYVIVGRTEIQGYMGKITEGWDYKEGPPMYPF